LRADPAATNSAPLLGPWAALVGIVGPEKNWQEWLDFSLLPPFERVAPLFHFSVYGLTANVEGVSFRMFSPAPPVPRETAAK
jgi:hypothetical protein